MNDATRRGFLTMAGAGAVVAGAAAVAPSALAAPPAAPQQVPPDASGSLVAYVHDVRKGELAIMVDGREVVVQDREVVAKLVRAAGSSTVREV